MFFRPVVLLHEPLLLSLLILWAALLLGGFLLGRPDAEISRRMPVWTRIGSSLTLALAAWLWLAKTLGSPLAAYTRCVAVGMTFGALGDLCMAGLLPLGQPVLGGMGAFALGHLAYIGAALHLVGLLEQDVPRLRLGAWGVWLVVGLVGWYVVVYRSRKDAALRWAALPYTLLLASMAGAASGLALCSPAFAPLALGAALFLVSDLMLAARLFSGVRFRLMEDVVWLTYGPAQMLIVYALAAPV